MGQRIVEIDYWGEKTLPCNAWVVPCATRVEPPTPTEKYYIYIAYSFSVFTEGLCDTIGIITRKPCKLP